MPWTNAYKAIGIDAKLAGNNYVGLHVGDPGTNGTNGEQSGENYVRPLVEFNAAGSDGIAENTNAEEYAAAGGDGWGTPTRWSAWTAASGGTMKGDFPITTPGAVAVGIIVRFAVGSLVAKINDPA